MPKEPPDARMGRLVPGRPPCGDFIESSNDRDIADRLPNLRVAVLPLNIFPDACLRYATSPVSCPLSPGPGWRCLRPANNRPLVRHMRSIDGQRTQTGSRQTHITM